jgi:hypothetical protein
VNIRRIDDLACIKVIGSSGAEAAGEVAEHHGQRLVERESEKMWPSIEVIGSSDEGERRAHCSRRRWRDDDERDLAHATQSIAFHRLDAGPLEPASRHGCQ